MYDGSKWLVGEFERCSCEECFCERKGGVGHGGANRANTPGRYFVMQKIHPQDFLMRTGAASPGSLLLSCPPPLFHSSTREEVLLLLSGSVIVFTAIRSLFAQQLCNLRGTLALSYSLETIPSAKACHKVKSPASQGTVFILLTYLLTYASVQLEIAQMPGSLDGLGDKFGLSL